VWGVKPPQAYWRARTLVLDGWLEPRGSGRAAGYALTERAKNAQVS
jgi:hypothetical protein